MAATLKQVAREANVSYQTVWRALHDVPGILPSTRDRVLQLAAKLGYRPNRVAGSLRTKRSTTIGLVVFDVNNTYTAQIISGIESCAAKRGHSVLLMTSGDDFERERKAILSLLERGVDGLIISAAAGGDHRYLRTELPDKFPLVAVNHPILGMPSLTVAACNREAGAAAGRHLLKHGHERIAVLFGNLANPSNFERHEGFVQSLRKAKFHVRKDWIHTGTNSIAFGRQAVRTLFDDSKPPTALFASTHLLTEGTLLGLRDIGLRHGHGVDVIGFDIRYAPLLDPPMPVLLQPAVEMGEVAANVLLDLIAGKTVPPPKRLPIALQTEHMHDPADTAPNAAPRRSARLRGSRSGRS